MYPKETRELAAEAVGLGFSLSEAAELAGCSRESVRRWLSAEGARAPRAAVRLPHERKMELVARYEAGERASDLGREAGVSGCAVTNWARRLREEGVLSLMADDEVRATAPEPAEPPSELEELRRRCGELELENAILRGTVDILKKDPGADPSDLTRAERAALAESLRAEFGLARVLAALSLPRSTFYHRLAAASAPDPYAALRPLVRAEFEASGGSCGPARVWAALRAGEGEPQRARGARSLDPARPVVASEKVVRRIMREEGLEARAASPAARPYSSYAGEEGMACAPNLLLADAARDLHDFSAARPGERLVTDITEFRLPDDPRKVYLSPCVDLFDGDVVAFSAGLSPSKALVAEMLGGAAEAVGGGFLLHSDRGWHYRTPDWVAECGRLGVTRSLSRKGHSPDNAAMEGFFGTLKVEFFRGRDWSGWTAERFIGALGGYVRWCREGRPRRSARAARPYTIRSGAAGSGSGLPPRHVQENVRGPLVNVYVSSNTLLSVQMRPTFCVDGCPSGRVKLVHTFVVSGSTTVSGGLPAEDATWLKPATAPTTSASAHASVATSANRLLPEWVFLRLLLEEHPLPSGVF